MKNILGTTDNLEFYNKEGKIVYKFKTDLDGFCFEKTYDSNGNVLTCKASNGYSSETTYNSNGKELTYKNLDGYSYEKTYDLKGNELTFKNSRGFSYEHTYDSNGNVLTYKDSDGVTRGFDIPEFTMQELVEKLGNFKIKK